MKIFIKSILIVLLFLGCKRESEVLKKPTRIIMYSGQVGASLEHQQYIIEKFNKENPDIYVELKDFYNVPQEQLAFINQIFSRGSSEIDIIQVDVIWPGDLAVHLIDLNKYSIDTSDFFSSVIANNTVDGRLVALPWYLDAGLLYYRRDLLAKYGKKVPLTWDELYRTAKDIQTQERKGGNSDFWGFVWQAGNGEGLTCIANEFFVSSSGNPIIASDKSVNIYSKENINILKKAKSWIGDITPYEALSFSGAEGPRRFWQTGNVLFMRNWPYAYNIGNSSDSPVKDLFRIAPLPSGESGNGASTLGGWQLGLSKYSKNPDAAFRVINYMTSYEIQKLRALKFGYYPTLRSLYNDELLLNSENPIFSQLLDVLDTTIARPSTLTAPNYNEFSQLFFTGIHDILSGSIEVSSGLQKLEKEISSMIRK